MNSKKIQAVFIDRDGTIGGTGNFIHLKEFQLYPFSAAALNLLKSKGFNCVKIRVKTGWGESSLNEYRSIWENVEPDYIADNLLQASKWIVENYESKFRFILQNSI